MSLQAPDARYETVAARPDRRWLGVGLIMVALELMTVGVLIARSVECDATPARPAVCAHALPVDATWLDLGTGL